MGGSLVIVGSNIPVGYSVPQFPSLSLPINSNNFRVSYLYFTYDIWRFTLYWTLILSMAFHLAAATWACIMNRKLLSGIWIFSTYFILAGIQAFASGSITGLILAAIYKSGMFAMSTWIPFVWGMIQVLFLVITSYSMTSTIL
jgi:hypothetical protein